MPDSDTAAELAVSKLWDERLGVPTNRWTGAQVGHVLELRAAGKSFEEIGEESGVTGERIRQIIKRNEFLLKYYGR